VPELEAAMAGQVMTSVKSSLANLDHEIEELQAQVRPTNMIGTAAQK
jgi:hypothetical protein